MSDISTSQDIDYCQYIKLLMLTVVDVNINGS